MRINLVLILLTLLVNECNSENPEPYFYGFGFDFFLSTWVVKTASWDVGWSASSTWNRFCGSDCFLIRIRPHCMVLILHFCLLRDSSGSNSGIRDPIQVRVKERATNMGTYFILTCSEGSVLRSLSIFSRPRASARDPAPGVKVTFGFFFLNTPQNNHLFLGRVPGTYLSNFVKAKDFFKSCVRFS